MLGIQLEIRSNALVITEVVANSNAERAELQPGDKIIRVNGSGVATLEQYKKVLARHKPGEKIVLSLVRDRHHFNLSVEVEPEGQLEPEEEEAGEPGLKFEPAVSATGESSLHDDPTMPGAGYFNRNIDQAWDEVDHPQTDSETEFYLEYIILAGLILLMLISLFFLID